MKTFTRVKAVTRLGGLRHGIYFNKLFTKLSKLHILLQLVSYKRPGSHSPLNQLDSQYIYCTKLNKKSIEKILLVIYELCRHQYFPSVIIVQSNGRKSSSSIKY